MELGEYRRMFTLESEHYWYRALQQHVLRLLPRYLSLSGASVLDAGCGTGLMGRLLGDQGALVTGLDNAPAALDLAHYRGIARLIEGSVNALPFPSESFDALISLDVWNHEQVEDRLAARESARVVKPGGIVLVNIPAYAWVSGHHDVVTHTVRRYSRRQVVSLFRQAGLELVYYSHWHLLLSPLVVLKRLASCPRTFAPNAASGPLTINPWLDRVLGRLLSLEKYLMPLPCGLSILAVGRKLG